MRPGSADDAALALAGHRPHIWRVMTPKLSLAALMALTLSGCVAPVGPVEVTRFTAPNAAGLGRGTIAVEPAPGMVADSLEWRTYATAVGRQLALLGYAEQAAGSGAQVALVRLQRQTFRPERDRSPVSVGMGGSAGSYGSGVGLGIGIDLSGPPADVVETELAVTIKDRVAATLILRTWAVPGSNDPDAVPLEVLGKVLGGLSSSRLDNALVRKEKLAVQVSAGIQSMNQLGIFMVQAIVRPGVDPAVVSKRLDGILAELTEKGPSADEVLRVATTNAVGTIAGLESVGGDGGKAVALAEGQILSNDPERYKKDLQALAAVTPERVRAAAQKWLTRPALTTMVVPGAREGYAESGPVAKAEAPAGQATAKGTRQQTLPDVGQIGDLDFPDVQRTRLSTASTRGSRM